MRAYRLSSNSPSWKATLKVATFRSLTSDISATMALESMPPDRNAPKGTSDRIRKSTLSIISSRMRLAAGPAL